MAELDADQAMLFGSIASQHTSEDPDAAADQLQVCALNVYSPRRGRGQLLADWLLATTADVLVLTEMQVSDGCHELLACLRAEGFTTTTSGPPAGGDKYFAALATRGYTVSPLVAASLGPRVAAVDAATAAGPVRLVAIYAPSNGMTAESGNRRRCFQQQALTYLRQIWCPAMLVAGDLNVVEPDHDPRLPAYADHDYGFYTGLLELGLRDAYRHHHPTGIDHSWLSARFGNQRIDHTLTGPGIGDIVSCGYDRTTIDAELSDHAAMVTTIRLPTAPYSAADDHATGAGASQ
ncbi:hypothetical protein OH799_11510 [Nocardia sp. NBC_00881]|uniref:endonuclease/exonuclease/phosphatase family protein n=1 Tax=Nocardia sp. NBC_00881 TaxID=2975995 RepID=UPI0038691FA3|nr:hypothetical protein OH799_11510 [Nocardia sp. NBC_00881]